MSTNNKDIDKYIAKAADFAKPILEHFREIIHTACPEVEEKIKWGMPFFDYKNEMMCHMASFKNHAVIGFWKAGLMKDPVLAATAKEETAMGHFGQLKSLKDLPSDKKLIAYIKEAMKLNDDGIKMIKKPRTAEKQELVVPDYFTKALAKNKKAKEIFNNFSYSHKKEYVGWITEAKTEATRDKRLVSAVEMIGEGKSRHWKYKNC